MIRAGAVDVDYPEPGGGRAALVVGDLPGFAVASERVAWLAEVEPYRPGSFYKRELPAIRAVLDGVEPVELLIVDGYVDLDPDGRPGLGAHVAAALGIPVIGVAKTVFRAATHAVPVLRGQASKPLYVTATGLALADAAAYVRGMRGAYRMPDALRRVDALARGRAG
ncbi:endonuclease V [Dactylosporangium matsuzakiense]|uniref:Endonuclease V n=1 Tax=Dactylosporangium matsuzakiense TaxID=53360 RepID=A0A9W6NSV0_9ACTN|nr:endonuclease V [Dactylosporangium matsuzakiense]UWZ45692.1 endonuclease V [Dactylosporangium matsuzakiense]GLL08770.1 endonuclease V [Dactylosporangium matsuzakiense]